MRDFWQYWVSSPDEAFTLAGIELLGTFILILLGNGIVATNLLNGTKNKNTSWLIIIVGWFGAIFTAVIITKGIGDVTGYVATGFVNPIFVINNIIKMFSIVPGNGSILAGTPIINGLLIIIGQGIGAAIGQLSIIFIFKKQYDETTNAKNILATFSTIPEKQDKSKSFFVEFLATFVFVLAISTIMTNDHYLNLSASLISAIFAALSGFSILISIGSTTGGSLNPVRDLVPRIVHQIIPKKILINKGDSEWDYAWIPVCAPFTGGILGLICAPGLFY